MTRRRIVLQGVAKAPQNCAGGGGVGGQSWIRREEVQCRRDRDFCVRDNEPLRNEMFSDAMGLGTPAPYFGGGEIKKIAFGRIRGTRGGGSTGTTATNGVWHRVVFSVRPTGRGAGGG